MNYLYKITNLVNSKIYIGVHKTDNVNDGYMGSGTAIRRAIVKYGIENFTKEILGQFDTYEEALLQEEQIVNLEFLRRKDVYNKRTGGIGGFEHINNLPASERNNVRAFRAKMASGELKPGGTANWTEESYRKMREAGLRGSAVGVQRALSDESRAKRKESFAKNGHAKGEKNSQFGTCWVTHSELGNKKINKTEINEFLSLGYTKGRKMVVN
jgi:hypothetical protein